MTRKRYWKYDRTTFRPGEYGDEDNWTADYSHVMKAEPTFIRDCIRTQTTAVSSNYEDDSWYYDTFSSVMVVL